MFEMLASFRIQDILKIEINGVIFFSFFFQLKFIKITILVCPSLFFMCSISDIIDI